MSKKYKNKYELLYEYCDTSTLIPINDVEAWVYYREYRWVYNKLELCHLQEIIHAPMPIEPPHFPIISKPIINLYGMGLNCAKITNIEEFYDQCWHTNNFWMEYINGEHHSFDLIVLNGKIVYSVCFRGYPLKGFTGAFDYWESLSVSLPESINLLMSKLGDYTGCLNVECIGGIIIDCHLRIGDIHQLHDDTIIKNIVALYTHKEWNLDSVSKKVFLFPVWSLKDQNPSSIITDEEMEILCQDPDIISYKIDTGEGSNPQNIYRMFNITSKSYSAGIELRDKLAIILGEQRIEKCHDI